MIIAGVLLGVQAKTGVAVTAINFKYKVYFPLTNITSIPTILTGVGQFYPTGGNPFDKEMPGFFITKIVGYEDSENIFRPTRLYRIDLTFSSIDGSKPSSVISLGTGFNQFWRQKATGTINIDYKMALVKKVIIAFDGNYSVISIEVITTDGVSQKLDNSIQWATYKSYDINGYLVGAAGRTGRGVDFLQFKYKAPA